MSDWASFQALAQQMYSEARARFRDMAEPLITSDAEREFATALEKAIGEVSPEEAIAGLLRFKAERG